MRNVWLFGGLATGLTAVALVIVTIVFSPLPTTIALTWWIGSNSR